MLGESVGDCSAYAMHTSESLTGENTIVWDMSIFIVSGFVVLVNAMARMQ